jgi:trehalose 6-phosphate synthase/phosphatase
MVHGLGDKLKLIALNKNFRKLNKRNVLEAYNRSNNRMLFFDNEGTLSNFMKQTEIDRKVGPSQRIIKALDCLCDDERNTVYVITGRPRDVVYNWFGSVYNLGMAAEYGALIKWSNSQEWESFFNVQSNWKVTAKEIISGYSERTEGSLLVEKESSVVFLYREADPEFGSYQAKELVIQLDFLLKPFMGEIEISEGIGYVEVKPQGINKGTALLRAIEKTSELKGPVDFIMAIGDDSSDEDMFKMVNLLKKQNSQILYSEKIPAFTCTLGIKPSSASYFLLDAAKVVNLLEHINGKTNRAKRNFSYDDLSKKSPAKALISNTILIHQLQVLEDLSEEENNLPRIESTDAFNI